MSRVLLIVPPAPERLRAPLLGLQYVAASLLESGAEVRIIDAASFGFSGDTASIVAQAREFEPQVIGIGLYTRWVVRAYELVQALKQPGTLLVAGGPHVTARPIEPLKHGFDVTLSGEAEHSLAGIVAEYDRGRPLWLIPGAAVLRPDGSIITGPAARHVEDLDALPLPQLAQELFAPEWYGGSNRTVPAGGIITSRGCPYSCVFCAARGRGSRPRRRSPSCVVDELNFCHTRYGTTFFPFWDDALTADRRHLLELCAHLRRGITFPLRWSAITRADGIDREIFRTMADAGCMSVDFGAESGDDEILRTVKPGLRTHQVVRALELAKDTGLTTACNFVLGFPQDTVSSLGRTLDFMRRIAPLVDSFSTLGVLVPLPGTPVYEEWHQRYGFTEWWLRAESCRRGEILQSFGSARFVSHYIDDETLGLDFFAYSDEVRSLIRECLKFKGEHNLRKMGLLQ